MDLAFKRAETLDDVARIRASLENVGRLSDNILQLGRFGIGLDGLLAWVPAVGTLYSLGAGGYLLLQGWRARLPVATLVTGLVLLSARSLVTALGESFLPFLPVELVVDVFRAHKWTADLMLRAIDATRYVEGGVSLGAKPNDRRRAVSLG
ncbi:DUF4112 domain-containing protein [Phenylobacterium montanum]|uniref:DUF4112 domain-containing protein n=1 Tax=Phenylobacterium montanum TaxID=2823693 RepID=A0A975G2T7_9CAUL|nr:DUF4112 domain-containing protein [Caulobacter sp. S6]QUD89457.1 DUF4112 domain-containing protein [Caulobacter sp. S6]